jgi:hypothetical protein
MLLSVNAPGRAATATLTASAICPGPGRDDPVGGARRLRGQRCPRRRHTAAMMILTTTWTARFSAATPAFSNWSPAIIS